MSQLSPELSFSADRRSASATTCAGNAHPVARLASTKNPATGFRFLQPVCGVLLAWLVLAENISLIFLLASSIIMVGGILAFRAR
jgi:hypothetical protein